MINIWFRYENKKPEIIDKCEPDSLQYMLREYRLAYGLYPFMPRYKKDKIWFGRKCDEPKEIS